MKKILYALGFLFVSFSAHAQVINSWTGNGGNSDWYDKANWSLNKLPSSCQKVIIPVLSGKPYPSLTRDVYAEDVTLEDGATLTTNDYNIYVGLPSFTVQINDIAAPCNQATALPLTATVTGADSTQYSYVWTLPDDYPDSTTETAPNSFSDTLIVNTPQTGVKRDSASRAILFKPANVPLGISGFSIEPGADYTAFITNVPVRNSPLTASQPGRYILSVTDLETGCVVSDTAYVERAGAPSVSVSGLDTLDCVRTSVTLEAFGSPQGITYGWTGPGVVAPATSYQLTASQPGTYTVTATNPTNGCATTKSVEVLRDITAPAATLAGGTLTCDPLNPLVLQPTGLSPANATFAWSGGNLDPYALPTTTNLSVSQPGTYQLKLTSPASRCTLALSASVVSNNNCTLPQACADTPPATAWNQITYERWNGISGGIVSNLTGHPKYQQAADFASVLPSFEAPPNVADNYGARISGYVVPPVGGSYTFWIAGDDAAILWLSTDESPSNKDTIAYISTYTGSRNYTANIKQKSVPITLECGKRYYIEALVKEATGGDHLSVSWQIPGQLWDQLPIAGQYLAPAPTCAFAIRAGDAPGVLADTGKVYQNAPLRLAVEKPAGWTDTFTWTAVDKHFVSNATATDSTNSRSSTDSVYVWPTSPGVYTYKVTSTTRATCFREFKLTVEDVACECTDCDLPEWQSEKVVANADVDLSAYPYAAVVENTYLAPTATLTGTTEISQTVTYLDGFGRTRQVVQTGVSPTGQDAVLPVAYDGLGRATKSYLPYVGGTGGGFKANAEAAQSSFYAALKGDGNAYSISVLEQSPLQRLEQQGSVGAAWQPVAGNQNKIGTDKASFRHNTTNDNITELSWNYAQNNWQVGKYAANRLFVTEYKDANNNRAEDFTDIYGLRVCTKVYTGSEVLTTYHAQDDFDRPRLMFPPNASVALEALSSGTYDFKTVTTVKDQIFWYNYDERGRAIENKTPDAETEETVYNPHNQVVLYRNGMHRAANHWIYTKYDELGRVHSRGVLDSNADRATQQAAVNTAFAGTIAYGDAAFPTTTNGTLTELSRNYYDDYTFTANGNPTSPAEFPVTAIGVTGPVTVRGKLTGTKEKILKAPGAAAVAVSELTSVFFYDQYERLVQTRSGNHLGTEDVSSVKRDFAGRALETKTTASAYAATTNIWTKNTYDRGERLKMTCQIINGGKKQPVGRYAYNELGELTEKWQGCKLQVVNYQTDLRGRLTAINNTANPVLLKKNNRFFGQTLQYDLLDNVQAQQWGNVASLVKNALVAATTRGYSYNYDPINRLKGAVYAGLAGEDFSLSNLNYDRNGNITAMQRAASTPTLGASPEEDKLSYFYAANSNRLVNVSDAGAASSSGKKAHYFNDRNTSGSNDDYAYDAAGNLVKDLNREITFMSYNVIGLPEEIRFANNTKIFYVYTADGAKVQKQGAYLPGSASGSTVQKKIDYAAAGVFTDQILTFIPTAEGRALPPIAALSGMAFRYEYQLTDHLDNLRTACRCGEKLDSLGNAVALLPSDNLRNLVQENAYDPWGLNLPDLERSAVLPDWWQFSTKERDYRAYDEFEFRHYDAAIGRFMSVDPLAELSSAQTVFGYASNNPSTFIDLYGLRTDHPSLSGWQKFGFFASGPAGAFINIGIQAYVAQNQPTLAADFNLSYLSGSGSPNSGRSLGCCPEKKGPGLFEDGGTVHQVFTAMNEFNPIAIAVNSAKAFATGTDVNGVAMSGVEATFNLATILPVGKIAKAGKTGYNIAKASRIFEVGIYSELRGAEAGLQAHHVGQKAVLKKFIAGYNLKEAPSILVPEVGHTIRGPLGIVSRKTVGFTNAREVLARDIFELRRVYPSIPNASLQELIKLNKSMYPNAFKK